MTDKGWKELEKTALIPLEILQFAIDTLPALFSNNVVFSRVVAFIANDLTLFKMNDSALHFAYSATFSNAHTIRQNLTMIQTKGKLWIETRFSNVLHQPYQSILMGMVLGRGGFLSDSIKHSIETMGIQHIFSVSGANFTVLAALLTFPLRKLSSRLQLCLILPICLLYSFLLGIQFPVLRACYMYLYSKIARNWLHVQSKPLYALFSWVCIVLLIEPASFNSISFQLTIAATMGILVAYKPILRLTASLLEGKFGANAFLEPLFLGVSAFLGVGPVLALHFKSVSFGSIFYTAVLYWVIELVSVAGFMTMGYICISWLLFSTTLRQFFDHIVGNMAMLVATPLVIVLRSGLAPFVFELQSTSIVQTVLWLLFLSVFSYQLSSLVRSQIARPLRVFRKRG